jgi:hypothetical protein
MLSPMLEHKRRGSRGLGARRATAIAAALAGAMAAGSSLAHCGGIASQGASSDASTAGDQTSSGGGGGDGGGATLDGNAGDTAHVGDGDASIGCGLSCTDGQAPFAVCPGVPPAVGAACDVPNEVCEYGSSWWYVCNTTRRCIAGQWTDPGGSAAECAYLDAGGCPATWAEAHATDATAPQCPFVSCVYPGEGFCGCGIGCGGGGAPTPAVTGFFMCFEAGAECPEPRPLMGTACTGTAFCSYGGACGCGQQQSCTDGVWQGGPIPPCP